MYFTKIMTALQGIRIPYTVLAFIILALTVLSCEAGSAMATPKYNCDILIVGGGTGGFAAALQACEMAEDSGITSIVMTEETTWLGGQYTSQGVTASDDNSLVEQGKYTIGASESYYRFHEEIKNKYRAQALETAKTTKRNGGPGAKAYEREIDWIESSKFSPGNAWGSRMSFLPLDGVEAIDRMLKPYVESGLLTVHFSTVPVKVYKDSRLVTGVRLSNTATGEETDIYAKITIDATELGDLFPLAGIDYSVGIESSDDTKEPSLFDENGIAIYPEAMPDCQQSFTFTFAVEWGPTNEDNRRPWDERPTNYEENRHRYTMVDRDRWFMMTRWNDFSREEVIKHNKATGENKSNTWIPSFWTYRRMLDARILDPSLSADNYDRFIEGTWVDVSDPDKYALHNAPNWQHSPPGVGDVIEVNWISNDYNAKPIIDVSSTERESAIREAKDLSLGFMFWLWYEAPRDPDNPHLDPSKEANWSIDPVTGKNTGWANLKFRPDVMGTEDGLSMYPYIRESRRQRSLFTVRQQHLMGPRTSRAKLFHDTIGIGHYFLDIHRCDEGCERKRDIQFKEVKHSDGRIGKENDSGRFQIPFGTLVPEQVDGFMAAAKNIGLSRIAASTYRLHPVEFEIGKAAAAAAVICVRDNVQPKDLWLPQAGENPGDAEKRLRKLQQLLLSSNTPLFWNEDAGWDHENFEAIQWACLLEIIEPHGRKFEPDVLMTRKEAVIAAARLSGKILTDGLCSVRFTDLGPGDEDLREAITIIEGSGAFDWIEGNSIEPMKLVTRKEFVTMIAAVTGKVSAASEKDSISRAQAAELIYREIQKRFGFQAE